MTILEKRKMVNGRVSELSAKQAMQVLKQDGLSMSEYIRNSVDYVARTGTVPPSGFPFRKKTTSEVSVLDELHRFENIPMPGKEDFPDLRGDELTDAIRKTRYGY